MKRTFGDYQRVAKSGGGSLWLGPDHLLVIENAGFILPFTEKYRRIDYANVQSLFWTTTRRRGQLMVVFGLLLVIFGLATYGTRDSTVGLAIWGALTVLMLVLLIINGAKGPTVDLRLQTAVQVLRLKPVRRLDKAEDLIRAVSPTCLEHQANAGMGVTDGPMADSTPAQTSTVPPIQRAGIKPPWPGSNLVRWALGIQIIAGLLTMADLFVPSFAFSIPVWIAEIAALVLVIAAFTRSLRFNLPRMVHTSLLGSTILHGIGLVLGFAVYIAAIVNGISSGVMDADSLIDDPNLAAMHYMAETHFNDLGWIGWSLLAWGFFVAAVGAIGLPQALSKTVEEKTAPPPVPAPPSPVTAQATQPSTSAER
jgi:hypothetical protein